MRVIVDVSKAKTQMKLQKFILANEETEEELSLWEGEEYRYLVIDLNNTVITFVDKCTPLADYIYEGKLPTLLI